MTIMDITYVIFNHMMTLMTLMTLVTLGIQANTVITDPVSTVDLAPTFLDMAGILHFAPKNMSKLSLLPVLSGDEAVPARDLLFFGISLSLSFFLSFCLAFIQR